MRFACRESERQRGILPGGVQCFAGVQSRGKGAGKIYTVGPGIRKPGQPVCGRHRSAGGNGRGRAGACSSGRKRQLPRPHPPPAAKAQCVAAPPYGRQDRRCAGCHDYRRPELSVFGHAQRLPGRGSCPCAGGKRNACVHLCGDILSTLLPYEWEQSYRRRRRRAVFRSLLAFC